MTFLSMIEDSSVTQRAYLRLKADLIACRLEPGKRINISYLQREMDFSQAAVREALSRLTSEGLVEIERHAGFRATPLSQSGFRELSVASVTIEVPCLRSAIENGDLTWEGNLVATFHISSRVLSRVVAGSEDLEKYTTHREAFYDALLAPCGNKWLLNAWKQLYVQQMRYRHTFRLLARYESGLTADFQQFIEAVLDRNVDKATRLCIENHEKVRTFVEEHIAGV
jgi:GntR family carbon starvation induced transcriptional regulator